jgi:hypothetical protein
MCGSSTASGCAARAPASSFVGSADIQSLADLGNSFEVVARHAMGAVYVADGSAPGRRHAASRLAVDVDDVFAGGPARPVCSLVF